MAVLADRNAGFEGTVTTAAWARIAGMGTRFAILGAGDLAVTQGAGDRGVRVAAGQAWGDGVLSEFDTATTLQGLTVASGSRWDTVVVRRDWQASTAQLRILAGGTAKAISTSRTVDAGATTSDQPIALVRFAAGSTVAQEVIDLRVWVGMGGTPVTPSVESLAYLGQVGTVVLVGDTRYVRQQVTGGALEWMGASQLVRRLKLAGTPTIPRDTMTPIVGLFVAMPGDSGNIPGGIRYEGGGIISVPSAGVYSVAAQFMFDPNVNGGGMRELFLYVNGQPGERTGAFSADVGLSLSTNLALKAGDTLQLYVRQAGVLQHPVHPTAEYKTWSVAKVG